MTDSNFNYSDSTSSSPIASLNSPIVDTPILRRTKRHYDFSKSGRAIEEPVVHASPFTVVVALRNSNGVPVYGQYWTMVRLAKCSPLLFPPGESSSSRPLEVAERGEAAPEPSRINDEVSSVHSDEVDSVVRSLMSCGESTTLEADIPEEDDDEALAELYMPPNETGNATFVHVNMGWVDVYLENRFCTKGPVYFAFPDEYKLLLPT